MSDECAFCENREVRERIVFENDVVFSFPSYQPIVPGHLLVVPKRHVETMEELSEEEMHALEYMRRDLLAPMKTALGAEGFHFAWNCGAVAGQTVPHLHLHVVPRKEGDVGITEYEPRSFLYRPGSRAVSEQAELMAVSQSILAAANV